MLHISVLCLLLAPSAYLDAQFSDARATWSARLEEDLTQGVLRNSEWYDVPVSLIFLARNYYKADNPATKLFTLRPLGLDEEVAEDFGVAGQVSPGSMDPWTIAHGVLAVRVLYALGNNLAGDANMQDEYAHAWTFYRALMYNHLLTELVKNTTSRMRPDDSDSKSFFSAHTSTAFVTSAFLYREADDAIDGWEWASQHAALRSGLKILTFSALYGWASYVGYSRVADKKHYVSDVLVGAAVGTLVGNVLYDHYFSEDETASLPRIGMTVIDRQPAISLSFGF